MNEPIELISNDRQLYNLNWSRSDYHPFAITSVRIEEMFYSPRKIFEWRSKRIWKARQMSSITSMQGVEKQTPEENGVFQFNVIIVLHGHVMFLLIVYHHLKRKLDFHLQGFDVLHPDVFHFCLVVGLVQ